MWRYVLLLEDPVYDVCGLSTRARVYTGASIGGVAESLDDSHPQMIWTSGAVDLLTS